MEETHAYNEEKTVVVCMWYNYYTDVLQGPSCDRPGQMCMIKKSVPESKPNWP